MLCFPQAGASVPYQYAIGTIRRRVPLHEAFSCSAGAVIVMEG